MHADASAWQPPGTTSHDVAFARDWLHEGLRFPQIREQLLREGLSHDQCTLTIADIAGELALMSLVRGKPSSVAAQTLIDRGMDVREASEVVDKAAKEYARRLKLVGVSVRPLLMLAAMCFVGGTAVLIAEQGGFKILPGLGLGFQLAAVAILGYALRERFAQSKRNRKR